MRVAVLSSKSLFVEGVALRLRQHLEAEMLVMVDAHQEDALGQVVAARPAVVILDAGDPASEQLCRLGQLLGALSLLTIIRLDSQSSRVRVVTSAERPISRVEDLVEMIKAAGE